MKRTCWAVLMLTVLFSAGHAGEIRTATGNSLFFTINQGQWDDEALFYSGFGGCDLWLTFRGPVFRLTRDISPQPDPHAGIVNTDIFETVRQNEVLIFRAVLVGASHEAAVTGLNLQSHHCNYYLGNDPERWAEDVPNYGEVLYTDIYPGIDLRYYFADGGLKYDFIVDPGADPSQIRVRYEGIESIEGTGSGELLIDTGWDTLVEGAPAAYQSGRGDTATPGVHYVLLDDCTFGFAVEDYDHYQTLIIDPAFEIQYSTYLGGSGKEWAVGVSIDGNNRPHVVGYTNSTNFPTRIPYQGVNDGGNDVFLSKFGALGDALMYSTYLGGTSDDYGYGVATDINNRAYITGWTSSSDFPALNPYQTYRGGKDVFVAKFSQSGQLMYSTYLGGSDEERGIAIAVDNYGRAYVTGSTSSPDFPTRRAFQGSLAGTWDIFVTKIGALGNGIFYSTYIGGSADEQGNGIDVDSYGRAYIAGYTQSHDFPLKNPFQSSYNGWSDAIVCKLGAGGDGLFYSTYLGGHYIDNASDIAVGPGNIAYVTGCTNSSDFPLKLPFQGSLPSDELDAFVTIFSYSGTALYFSTYLGGTGEEQTEDIDVYRTGYFGVCGFTESTDFPTMDPLQAEYSGGFDGFFSKFVPSGSQLYFSTYLGGSRQDNCSAFAFDGSCNPVIVGMTKSLDFPLMNPFQGTYGGEDYDAFVMKLRESDRDDQSSHDAVTDFNTPNAIETSPNPFNDQLQIRFQVECSTAVEVTVYDVAGRCVAELASGIMEPGSQSLSWDSEGHPSGVYVVRVFLGDGGTLSERVLLIR